jgi:hypothetical protein
VKIDAEHAPMAPTPHGGTLSATNFDQSEWEIMYPQFVTESLIDPSDYVNS